MDAWGSQISEDLQQALSIPSIKFEFRILLSRL
jgi:hypothetical protein